MSMLRSFFLLLLLILTQSMEYLPNGMASMRYEMASNETGSWVLDYDPRYKLTYVGLKLCKCQCSTSSPTDFEVRVTDQSGRTQNCQNQNELIKFIEKGTIWFKCKTNKGGIKRKQITVSRVNQQPLQQQDVVLIVPNFRGGRGKTYLKKFKTGRYNDNFLIVRNYMQISSSQYHMYTVNNKDGLNLVVKFTTPFYVTRLSLDAPDTASLGVSLYSSFNLKDLHHEVHYKPQMTFGQPSSKDITLWGSVDATQGMLFHGPDDFADKLNKIQLSFVQNDQVQSFTLFPKPHVIVRDSYTQTPSFETDQQTNTVIIDFGSDVVPRHISVIFSQVRPDVEIKVALTNSRTPSDDETVHILTQKVPQEDITVVGVDSAKRFLIFKAEDPTHKLNIQSVSVSLLTPWNSLHNVTVTEGPRKEIKDEDIKVIKVPYITKPSINIRFDTDSSVVKSNVDVYVTTNQDPKIQADWVHCKKTDTRSDGMQLKCDREVQGSVSLVLVSQEWDSLVVPDFKVTFQDQYFNPIVKVEVHVETEIEVAQQQPSDILKDITDTAVIFQVPRLDRPSSSINVISDNLFTENQVEIYVTSRSNSIYQRDLIHCRKGRTEGKKQELQCDREIQGDIFLVVIGSAFQLNSDVIATIQFKDRQQNVIETTKIVIIKEAVIPPMNDPIFFDISSINKDFNYIKIDDASNFLRYKARIFFTKYKDSKPSEWTTCNQVVETDAHNDLLMRCSDTIKASDATQAVVTYEDGDGSILKIVLQLLDQLHLTLATITFTIPTIPRTPPPSPPSPEPGFSVVNLPNVAFDKITFSTNDHRIPAYQAPLEVYLTRGNDKVYCTYQQTYHNDKDHTYICNNGVAMTYNYLYVKFLPTLPSSESTIEFNMAFFNSAQNPYSPISTSSLSITLSKAQEITVKSGQVEKYTFFLMDLTSITDPIDRVDITQKSGNIASHLYRIFPLSYPLSLEEFTNDVWKDKTLEEITDSKGGRECRATESGIQRASVDCFSHRTPYLLIIFNRESLQQSGSYHLSGVTSFEAFHGSNKLFSVNFSLSVNKDTQ